MSRGNGLTQRELYAIRKKALKVLTQMKLDDDVPELRRQMRVAGFLRHVTSLTVALKGRT